MPLFEPLSVALLRQYDQIRRAAAGDSDFMDLANHAYDMYLACLDIEAQAEGEDVENDDLDEALSDLQRALRNTKYSGATCKTAVDIVDVVSEILDDYNKLQGVRAEAVDALASLAMDFEQDQDFPREKALSSLEATIAALEGAAE